MGSKNGKLARRRGGSSSSSSSTSSVFLGDHSNNDTSSKYYYVYYYSSENTQSANDPEPDEGSSSKSSLRADTRKGIPSDAHGSQRGAERRYPVLYPVNDLKILGKGAYAVVYLSYSEANKMHFAVKRAKRLRPRILKSLTREADVLKQLSSPYIIEYLGERRVPVTLKPSSSATCPESVPMVSEIYLPYMERGTLADEISGYLQKKQLMIESVILNYAKQILSGLSYLHSKKILHCDIKGSNILIGKTNLKISDFGVCKHIRNTPSENRGSISGAGTQNYMAPEVKKGIEQGFPADVWSFGCTVVQMITGKPPVTGELKSFLMQETLLAERTHSPEIPEEFQRLSFECVDFVKKCFFKDTKARWTCKQLLDHPFLKANEVLQIITRD